jgi:hypothetical protein
MNGRVWGLVVVRTHKLPVAIRVSDAIVIDGQWTRTHDDDASTITSIPVAELRWAVHSRFANSRKSCMAPPRVSRLGSSMIRGHADVVA